MRYNFWALVIEYVSIFACSYLCDLPFNRVVRGESGWGKRGEQFYVQMETREETVSETLLDSNQAMLITHPHKITYSDTHAYTHTDTHTQTKTIYAKRMKADGRQ